MKIVSDWHIHSQNSCDSACITVSDLVREAEKKGICDFGLTDHLHTPYNLSDIARSREEFLSTATSSSFHFGVEVSCVSQSRQSCLTRTIQKGLPLDTWNTWLNSNRRAFV